MGQLILCLLLHDSPTAFVFWAPPAPTPPCSRAPAIANATAWPCPPLPAWWILGWFQTMGKLGKNPGFPMVFSPHG